MSAPELTSFSYLLHLSRRCNRTISPTQRGADSHPLQLQPLVERNECPNISPTRSLGCASPLEEPPHRLLCVSGPQRSRLLDRSLRSPFASLNLDHSSWPPSTPSRCRCPPSSRMYCGPLRARCCGCRARSRRRKPSSSSVRSTSATCSRSAAAALVPSRRVAPAGLERCPCRCTCS